MFQVGPPSGNEQPIPIRGGIGFRGWDADGPPEVMGRWQPRGQGELKRLGSQPKLQIRIFGCLILKSFVEAANKGLVIRAAPGREGALMVDFP